VAAELQQLSAWDGAGLSVVVEALGSERASVATSAAVALDQQLDRWRELPPADASRRLANLARGLANRVDRWPAGARSAASDLALRILDWPLDARAVSRRAVIADCEHVLRVQGADAQLVASASPGPLSRPDTTRAAGRSPTDPQQPAVDVTPAALAGGDLPVAEHDSAPLPPAVPGVTQPRSIGDQEPALLPTPQMDDLTGDETPTAEHSGRERTRRPEETPQDGLSSIRPLSNETAAGLEVDFETLPDRALFPYLDGYDGRWTELAEKTLRQRGYQQLDLALARKLVSADVATRRELVDTAAQLSHGAGRWLVWLSQDPEPGVRQTAVSLMVTAQDPRVRRRLLEMETTEADEEVQLLRTPAPGRVPGTSAAAPAIAPATGVAAT
jgi:hypothetical protein